ncbi:SdrD B-like domain-containing protein [Patulibacter sp. SYSU D01012]|uniref:SdrD B-like domain-containing protein n=1 Tax=Patulibacter sp. SYSU D01012 TaxID=2817381 RepID=UPI001B301DAA|nr:SdrD B-like domain-containing protein [Patulibacter sp. SYSU D01012]
MLRAAAPLVAVAALAAVPAAADAALSTQVALDQSVTGTAPWDATAGPGRDTTASDDVVRTNDTVSYRWSVNVNETTGQQGTFDKVTFKQTLAEGLSWRADDVPAYCKGPGWGIDGRTLTCVFVPSGGKGQTGTTLNFTLTASADGVADGTVATAPADAVSVVAHSGDAESPAAKATPRPVTIRSAPFLDFQKNQPSISRAGNANTADYDIAYPIDVVVPQSRRSTYGQRGFALPDVPITLEDDLSGISPNVEFVGCGNREGTEATCVLDGKRVRITITKLRNGASSTNPNVAHLTLRVRVPRTDVITGDERQRNTVNVIDRFDAGAQAADGDRVPFEGDDAGNNSRAYNLTADSGVDFGGIRFGKRLRTATDGRLATQTADDDGNGQVLAGQRISTRLTITGRRQTGALCDVWDRRTLSLTREGLDAGAAPVRAASVPSGWTAGEDYVVEYGTEAAPTGDDETRWAADRARTACTDASDTWTTTPPADLGTVTKIRIRLLRDLPEQFTDVSLSFLANMKVAADAPNGTTVANFLGTQAEGGAWKASGYAPATHGDRGTGDRARVNGITVSLQKVALTPAANPGSPVSIVSGGRVQFGLSPRVSTPSDAIANPTATNVVVRDRLPEGMQFDASAPTGPDGIAPTVSTDADGREILTWRIPKMVRGEEPQLTYWATTVETKAGDLVNGAIVDSAEDTDGLDEFPTNPTTTGDQHFSRQTVRLQSPGGVRVSKSTRQLFVEPEDALRYTVTYANLTENAANGVDVIDVLPFAGDGQTHGGTVGRDPATAFAGTVPLAGVDVSDGETVRYTDAPPAAVFAATDPQSSTGYGPLPAGYDWCLESELGDAGCPDALEDATAVRVQRTTPLAAGEDVDFDVRLQPRGNASGDLYSNTAAVRYTGGSLGAVSNVRTIRVVASSIGDYVWEDANQDGRQDADEKPLPNVRVTLTGTDKHGREISLETRTDADGKYLFTSSTQAGQDAGVHDLVSGRYVVTFHKDGLPTGTRFTTTRADGVGAAEDSDADATTGRSQEIVLPDPSPTGKDGQDLTIDAGIVIGPGDPPVQPPTTPEQPPVPPTTPPAPPTPPLVAGEQEQGVARLSLVKRASAKVVRAGRTVTYRLTVKNRGNAVANRVRVCDTLPAGTTVVSRGGGRLRGGKVCWTARRLAPGKAVTRTLTLRVDREARTGTVVNRATASATGVRTARARRSVRVQAVAPTALSGSYVTG